VLWLQLLDLKCGPYVQDGALKVGGVSRLVPYHGKRVYRGNYRMPLQIDFTNSKLLCFGF